MNLIQLLAYWKPIIEIIILWFVIYHALIFFAGTRSIQVLRGVVILLFVFFIIQKFDFIILDWLFTKLFAVSILAIMVIFQPEIRQGLARLGQRHLFEPTIKEEEFDVILKETVKAVDILSKNKIGALIAIAKEDPLTEYIESGVNIDGQVTSDLIQNIFTPNSLLHDGGTVIQHGRIVAAGCLFPLTLKQDISRIFGTRHRAAIGLSEQTDAIIIVVSEERQDMSLVSGGRMFKDLSKDDMFLKIKELIKTKKEND